MTLHLKKWAKKWALKQQNDRINKMNTFNKDKIIALLFFLLTLLFIFVAMNNKTFFNWVFERHQNQWSWYLRPIFLIPFCFFSYKKSWSGISISIFCLFTSMFWFNQPETVSDSVKFFLQFEKKWLYGSWNFIKIGLIATVPISFFVLGLAFWKRSLLMGLSIIVLMATGKIIWSIENTGSAGKSIIMPAMVGLSFCLILLFYGFKKLKKKQFKN